LAPHTQNITPPPPPSAQQARPEQQQGKPGENYGASNQFGHPAQGASEATLGGRRGTPQSAGQPDPSQAPRPYPPAEERSGREPTPQPSPRAADTPRSSDALREHLRATDLITPHKEAPSKGWRKALLKISGGLINVGESSDERTVRDLKAAIGANLRGTYTVVVLGGKGGSGKTAMTIATASEFARIRNDQVVAVDADPAQAANLAARVDPKASSLRAINDDLNLHRYADVGALAGHNDVGLDVVASPRHGGARGGVLTAEEFIKGHMRLQRFYSVLFVDCGVDLDHAVMKGVLERADALLMVASAVPDGAEGASTNFEWLRDEGHHQLISRTALVINHIRPARNRKDRKEAAKLVATLREHFAGWVKTQRIIEVPFDAHIAEAGKLDLRRVSPKTARAVLETAAALAAGFSTTADAR
jgi:MinD-like ATPase involved in chromosome partitioning or flagellar assembly